MTALEHGDHVKSVTTKISDGVATIIATGIVALVSSHIYLLVQVASINQKLTGLDGFYSKENAKTDFALQSLTDTKQDALIQANKDGVADLRSRVNSVENNLNALKNKIDQ